MNIEDEAELLKVLNEMLDFSIEWKVRVNIFSELYLVNVRVTKLAL